MNKPIHTLEELQTYLSGAAAVAFDFETAPDDGYRKEEKAALDAHKSHIAGISFSVAEGDGIYLPISHRVGKNAENLTDIWQWLKSFFADSAVTKVAYNLSFESAFLYARGIVIQEPVYDTIAALCGDILFIIICVPLVFDKRMLYLYNMPRGVIAWRSIQPPLNGFCLLSNRRSFVLTRCPQMRILLIIHL